PFASERILIRALDVTKENEREALLEEINWRFGGVDVLINNAGISYRSVLEHMTEDEELHQLQVNFLGPMALTRLVLPQMRKKSDESDRITLTCAACPRYSRRRSILLVTSIASAPHLSPDTLLGSAKRSPRAPTDGQIKIHLDG